MIKFNTITIIGATGLVGQEFIGLLKNFDYSQFQLNLISNSFVGQTCSVTSKQYQSMESIDFSIPTIFINCANAEQASFIAKNISGISVLIDNSSEYRMNSSVPLIIPEINWYDYETYGSNIIANPNCSTIILSMLLKPFVENNIDINRLVVSTYQAASGAGKEGLEELKRQTQEISTSQELTTKFWKQQYVFNTFVHNSPIEPNGYCQEENKLVNETNKIFKKKFRISPTCIRVPVLRSHCESVNIEFNEKVDIKTIYDLISNEKDTLQLINNVSEHVFPSSLSSNGSHLVQVGHIRADASLPNNIGWNFWISGDQLLRGAAFNAFLIMKKLVSQ
jgi:aspartate-semialdehyde dehydrogenase